jgi:hypothetical protein
MTDREIAENALLDRIRVLAAVMCDNFISLQTMIGKGHNAKVYIDDITALLKKIENIGGVDFRGINVRVEKAKDVN